MVDIKRTVWIDSTFLDKKKGTPDVPAEYMVVEPDIIGSYNLPVDLYSPTPEMSFVDQQVKFGADYTMTSDHKNMGVRYIYDPTTYSGLFTVPHEYFNIASTVNSGSLTYKAYYTTGYTPVSGTVDKKLIFTVGRSVDSKFNMLVDLVHYSTTSGIIEQVANYTNFSGNTNVSGEPIPFYYRESDINTEYGSLRYTQVSGGIDNYVDVSFAGWIYHALNANVYSVDEGYASGYTLNATTLSGGGLKANYLEAAVGEVTTSGILYDVYCSLETMVSMYSETETIKGKIATVLSEVESCGQKFGSLTLDVNIFPIRFINFSLDIGEHTAADGLIYVDVIDESCSISVSGTYFMVDGVRAPVTLSGILDGYRMYYDPEDDFSSLEGPTTFTAHAENECGQTLEQDYYLTFGYIAEYENHPSSWQGINYGYDNKVAVRVIAENWASCPQTSSLAWDFDSRPEFNRNLGASIVGQFHDEDASDLSAEIKPYSLAYFYGKEFEVVLTAKDFAGNEMEPFILKYRIEDKPEN